MERKNIIDFLIKQFKNKAVSKLEIENLWQDHQAVNIFKMARFQIINQKLYTDSFYLGHYYYPVLVKYFQELVKKYKIKDVDFIIFLREELHDEAVSKKYFNFPAFMMFQDQNSKYEQAKLLFPDAKFLDEYWPNLLKRIDTASLGNDWLQKKQILYWRGACTGGQYNLENFSDLSRIKTVILSKLYPNIIDAKFANFNPKFVPNVDQFSNNQSGQALRTALFLMDVTTEKNIKEEEHLQYKYLLSIDGNSATGMRVPWIMYSNSVLVKQESKKIQWYYAALEPYVHYVPLKRDLTDVFEQFEWLKRNDCKLLQIQVNAHQFVQNNLFPEQIDAHVVILLNTYHEIQNDKNIVPSLTPAEEVFELPSLLKNLFYRLRTKFFWKTGIWF